MFNHSGLVFQVHREAGETEEAEGGERAAAAEVQTLALRKGALRRDMVY